MTYEYEWGSFAQGENYFLEDVVEENSTYDIYFTATGSQSIYAYFDLYGFTDDLDLALYQYSVSLNEYTLIKVSEEEGDVEESIFKGLTPGDYILEISHYSDLDYSSAASAFTVDFNSVDYYENSLLPNDTLFASQWHLLNTGQAGGIDDEDIFAPEAWNIRSTSPDVVVAVIDGGMQLDHPDLDDNLWINSAEIFGNGIDDDNNGYVDDIYGWNFPANSNLPFAHSHGTHVAGIIGAEGNNGTGTTGVTWDTQLMSLDVFNGSDGASDSDIIDAIYYAADNGADVINMSLGGTYEYTTIADWRIFDPNSYAAYYEALSYAVNQGSTIVIAAGNEDAHAGTHLSIPAAFSSVIDGVISVAAITNTGDLTEYSNYGSLVTVAAPGGSHDEGTGILSTVPTGRYEGMPGTSMASPIVAGAAALIKAENPNFTPVDIESIITDSADKYRDMSSLVQDGNYLNLKDALTLAQTYQPSFMPTPTPAPDPTPTPTPTPITSESTYVEKDGDIYLLIDANKLYYAQNSNSSGTFDVLESNGTQYKKSKQWQLHALENINGTNTGLWQFKNKSYSTWEYDDNWKEIKNSGIRFKTSEIENFGQDSLIPQDDQQGNPNGMNIIEGTNNKNRLKGSNGADKIFGYEGADKIDGKKGDDIIDPGIWKKGKFDVVKGGSGSDTFILKDGYWAYIKDFKIFEDKLDLSGIIGGYSWEYWKKQRQTYIFDDNDIELARIKGDVDIDSADVIM